MPKPQIVERHIRDWLKENGHDDLVAWARPYHLDAPMRRGHLVRYIALDLPEGRLAPNGKPATFVFDSFVHTTKGGKKTPLVDVSDAFIAAFGDSANCIEA